ncbi:hypothetical protein EXIGLDRAFT_784166 [Exidia glandulosa HHB12029]|uniref:Uncharacterized protein n=1 Tax=Exidia glandulosa HHB12029 TaxID=1314781 RepID=A0A166MMV5_EXIGL|nr:hypothetical protein EXIGLDRAFT_784166 [Exidia glandulosa HHB12029]
MLASIGIVIDFVKPDVDTGGAINRDRYREFTDNARWCLPAAEWLAVNIRRVCNAAIPSDADFVDHAAELRYDDEDEDMSDEDEDEDEEHDVYYRDKSGTVDACLGLRVGLWHAVCIRSALKNFDASTKCTTVLRRLDEEPDLRLLVAVAGSGCERGCTQKECPDDAHLFHEDAGSGLSPLRPMLHDGTVAIVAIVAAHHSRSALCPTIVNKTALVHVTALVGRRGCGLSSSSS